MTNRERAIKRVAEAWGYGWNERAIKECSDPANPDEQVEAIVYAVDTTEWLLVLEAALTNIAKRFDDADEGTLHVRDGVAWAMASDARAALRTKGE